MTTREEGWIQYIRNTENCPPRPLLERAVAHVRNKGIALDLGAGALNDCRYLLEVGFESVDAIDFIKLEDNAKLLPKNKFRYIQAEFETFEFPVATYNLVNSQLSLPFTKPEHFQHVFRDMISSLRPGGLFAGQLYGERDWRFGDPEMTFHTADTVKSLFTKSTDLIYFSDEEDWMAQWAAGGTNHVHFFHIIARRHSNVSD